MDRHGVMRRLAFLGFISMSFLMAGTQAQAKKAVKSYTIGPKAAPLEKETKKKKTYNKKTRQYYVIQSYLNKLGEKGGTLKLKKGTYKIPRTLYVPSDVSIQLKSGAKLVKTEDTGTKKLKSTKFLFQLISEKKATNGKLVGGYRASQNVSIKGSTDSEISLGKVKGATAVYAGHANTVTIEKIKFTNRQGGSYIWVEGSKNVSIQKCDFQKAVSVSGLENQMAVRLEVINSEINDFSGLWSRLDNTVNKNIIIEDNQFSGNEIGVGSAKYASTDASPLYQTKVQVKNNTFTDIKNYDIYAMVWKTPDISANVMSRSSKGPRSICPVYGLGVDEPAISSNTISGCQYAVQFVTALNEGSGSSLPSVVSQIGEESLKSMDTNTVSDAEHYYVAMDGSRLFYFQDKRDNKFTIRTDSIPYREKYMDYVNYNSKKYYYIFLSYMEQLEYAGGGTITVEAGEYPVTNNICIPSNVTLKLKDGVTFKKAGTTVYDICYAKTIFTIVPPSKDNTVKTVTGYNGSHDVKIQGSGTVVMDCDNVLNAMAIVMGHTKNVTISGITFRNEYGCHFIELNSSKNAVVEKCHFENFKPVDGKSHKECINIDGTDNYIEGFNYDWSAHDKTTCQDVFIRNNTFKNITTAVGSHTYFADGETQKYQTNIQIYDNEVTDTYNAAFRVLNWKDFVIRDNTIKNIHALADTSTGVSDEDSNYVAMLLRGAVNPTVTQNTFENLTYYPIRVIMTTQPNTETAVKGGYPPTVSQISDENWAAMLDNELVNVAKPKYKAIIVRETDDQKDSKAEKKKFAAGGESSDEGSSGPDDEPEEGEDESDEEMTDTTD